MQIKLCYLHRALCWNELFNLRILNLLETTHHLFYYFLFLYSLQKKKSINYNFKISLSWTRESNFGSSYPFHLTRYSTTTYHITPVLINLHWIPVRFRIHFRILILTFKTLYGMAPSYIIDLIHTKTNTRYLLRSNEGVLLKHPSGKMKKSFGDRSFSVAAPTLWNALPVSLRSIKCISTFNSNVKTYLFTLAFKIS